MRNNTFLRNAIALSTVLFFSACEHLQDVEQTGINHVVQVDISGSALHDLPDHAAAIEARLLRHLGAKDRLVVLPIDHASLTHVKPMFELDMASKNFEDPSMPITTRKAMADHARGEYLQRVSAGFKDRLAKAAEERQDNRKYTDIFGALRQAAQEVREGRSNQLWLLCDMLHESESMNMDRLQRAGKPLEGVRNQAPRIELPFDRVLIFTGDNSKLGGKRFAELESFWKRWFSDQGLTVGIYASGGIRNEMVQR